MDIPRHQPPIPIGASLPEAGSPEGLHQLVELVVASNPEAAAVRCGETSLTYEELNRRANQCAGYLRDLGVGPEVVVAVLMERSVEMIVGLLAILKAGGAYLPLDPEYPRERLGFILADTGASILLTRTASAEAAESLGVTALSLEAEQEFLAGLPPGNPPGLTKPGNLAYVIYTSGSTGKPKGCMNTHAAICNRLVWMRDHYAVSPQDRILQKTPYTFDVSVWELFLPLISGSTLVFAKPGGHKDNDYLIDLIQREGVTICHFVPSMLRFFVRQPGAGACRSLRHVFASGEALPYGLMSQFLQTLPARLHNLYGPTEAAVDVTYWECRERPDQKTPIGRPISQTQIHILDENLRPVPAGEAGELYIGGVGVGRGYYNRPGLTRERFVQDPFSSDPQARLYRSGDKARLLPDGEIEFLGRLDFQVKVRGFRIELGEIEETLREHEAIEDAAVIVRGEESEDPKLAAYIVYRNQPLSIKAVRDFVQTKLPAHMCPNLVVPVRSLPVNAHGKLDRGALPALEPTQAASELALKEVGSEAAAAARIGSVTSDLLDHFRKILAADLLSATDDLFDSGATSFTIVQSVERIRARHGVLVPVDVFFDTPNILAIAGHIVRNQAAAPAGPPSPPPAVSERPAPEPPARNVVVLPRPSFKEKAYTSASMDKSFSGEPVSPAALGRWISVIKHTPNRTGPNYLYSSAGGLRPVQAYLMVRRNGVVGLDEGSYYYHPEEHALYPIKEGLAFGLTSLHRQSEVEFGPAGFAVFLIAQLDAIEPIYREISLDLVTLEAGYVAQALREHQESFGLSLRPVLEIDFEPFREAFRLEPGHRFLHCLLGGIPARSGPRARTPSLQGGARPNHPADLPGRSQSPGEPTISRPIAPADQGESFPDPADAAELHRKKPHLRRFDPAAARITLEAWEPDRGYFLLRSAKRSYGHSPVPMAEFARFLGLLASENPKGDARHLFPALAGAPALTAFVWIKPGSVENLPGGLYRHDAVRHELHRVRESLSADLKSCFTPFNRKHYQSSKFCLFLTGPEEDSLRGFEGKDRPRALLEAGYIGQLLLDRQAEFAMGICPIGGIRFEKIRADFDLNPGESFLHAFVGGGVPPECPIPWETLETGGRAPADAPGLASGMTATRPRPHRRDAVAVVGMSGRYPGAGDLDAFAANLKSGQCGFRELLFEDPAACREEVAAPKTAAAHRQWGGFLHDIECFDSLLFQITPAEARTMDPQERLFLEVAWECLEDSGHTGLELNRVAPKTGVFIGAMWDDYQHHSPDVWRDGRPETAVSAHHSSIANRVSFFFDFKGPSVSVNTSCSSALTAVHSACQSLLAGECDAALVGGVNLMAHPYHHGLLSALGFLSEDEQCHPFGLHASGWVAGEGVGAVLLKPLDEAVRHGDTIRGVILAATVGCAGRTSRYGAPDADGQARSIREALTAAGAAAESISYIEAAAPGAGMADAAEAAALKSVFGGAVASGATVHVGSVKGNIGHIESASAMSQLAKVLLQLRDGQIFPTLGFEPVNPLIQWTDTPLKICGRTIPWPAGSNTSTGARRALINAFGATGSGGHLIIEEYPASETADTEEETLIPLSAATRPQLEMAAGRLRDFLDQPRAARAPIADIGRTLRLGRAHMKVRLACVVRSRRELREALSAFLAREPNHPGLFTGQTGGETRSETASPHANLSQAEQWVLGACGLGRMPGDDGARRIPLPTYPFARERHWIGRKPGAPAGPRHDSATPYRPEAADHLKRLFAGVTGIPPEKIDTRASFDDYGLTSLMIQQLNDLLAKDFGPLPASLLFEYPGIEPLAGYFAERHQPGLDAMFKTSALEGRPSPQAEDSETLAARPASNLPLRGSAVLRDVAIVGVSGKYPKSANLFAFWDNLQNGVDCVSEIPASRWDDAGLQKTAGPHSKWGGFLDGVDEFDPFFFRISPGEAEEMDPQERLFLQTVWHLFEDAGYDPSAIARGTRDRTGVFVGVMYGEYQLHSRWNERDQAGVPVGAMYGSIANRVSYFFDFHGPSMAVDTLCSSSLTALHLAVGSIQSGECEAAVVGGVNISIHPNKYLLHARTAMSSSDGRCRSFGSGGDGFVPGEGVGAVLLKPLVNALRDGDQIYGVVRATSVNHDGKTHGYTVPNPNAQADMISEALRKSGVDPRSVSYVEAHGTGTSLGDPIEIAGLAKAFGAFTAETGFCAIGSVKSNIGHLESAAGIAGLTKILLQMRHRKLVPSLHSEKLNPGIRFEQTPFTVQQTLAEWNPPVFEADAMARPPARIACISSFGAGGSNAHAIIEEFEAEAAPDTARPPATPQLIVLSAKDPGRLTESISQLHDFLLAREPASLAGLARTLQVGRAHMEERLAFAVSSHQELVDRLAEALKTGGKSTGFHRGTLTQGKPRGDSMLDDDELRAVVHSWVNQGKFDRVLEAWVKGASVDWSRLHGPSPPRRVSMPGYPFARERYWVPGREGGVRPNPPRDSWLHPLLHRNTSDLWETRFTSKFDGTEFFLRDHRLNGEPILPAAAMLEMARAAIANAAGARPTPFRLQYIAWTSPFIISGPPREIHASLLLDDAGNVRFELHTGDMGGPRAVVSQGGASLTAAGPLPVLDLPGLRHRLPRIESLADQCHDQFRASGLDHGPSFLSFQEFYRDSKEVLARLVADPSLDATFDSYGLHPALLDSLFQATLALAETGSCPAPGLPYALDELIYARPFTREMWAHVRPAPENLEKLDLVLCDPAGNICAQIRGFSTRPIHRKAAPGPTILQKPVLKPAVLCRSSDALSWENHIVMLCGMKSGVRSALAEGPRGVLCVEAPIVEGGPAAQFESTAVLILQQIQRILGEKPRGNVLFQALIPAGGDGLAYRGLSGLLQTAHQESPAFFGQLVEIDPDTPIPSIAAIILENRNQPREARLVYQHGTRSILSWEDLPPRAATGLVPWKNGGAYLITGGAGGLGLLFAREILRQTDACALILTGRSSPSAEKQERLRALEQPGKTVRFIQSDVTDPEAARTLLGQIMREHGGLQGIIHAAGILRDQFIIKKSEAEFRETLAPKTRGVICLDEVSRDLDLDFFILFSSTSGALGNAGQVDYAAANGFMDGFAAARQEMVREGKRRGRTLSVNWPLWREGGMKIDEATLDLLGEAPLESGPGMEAFLRAFYSDSPQVMVKTRPAPSVRAPASPAAPPVAGVTARPTVGGDSNLSEKTLRFFRELLASTVKCPVERIKVDEPFEAYGIDSVMAMRMTNELEKPFGSLSKTLFFEHQTVRSLADHFLQTRESQLRNLLAAGAPPPAPVANGEPRPAPAGRKPARSAFIPPINRATGSNPSDIAVIGLAGRYPQAENLDTFWKNLCEGKDCITEIPPDRWDWRRFYSTDRTRPGAHYSKWGGFMEDVDKFDPLFFNIAPNDARFMDPQERIFLETAWAALEDAGCRPEDLRGAPGPRLPSQVGVYAGVMYSEYQLLAHEETMRGNPTAAGGIYASIANRVSYFLDLHGPSISVDTMCSSSLTCVHMACQDLRNRVTELAIAGGVNVTIHPNKYLLLSDGQFISTEGHCGSFGQGGDGYIPGEGVGVAVLKRLDDALRDGDQIYGVIKGGAVNHGGKTNGFSVPNPNAQSEVISKALEASGLAPGRVTYIEAHGTGTELGDPIEVAGLAKAFSGGAPGSRCWLGSVKSNIGHGEAAAGIAGLTKILLQMRHGKLVPSLHSATLNPHIDFKSTPFEVNQSLRDWDRQVADGRPLPRVAGISGFGAGGSNAHLIVEEFLPAPEPVRAATVPGPWIFILSARDGDRLREMARRLGRFVQNEPGLRLPDIALTLQAGRQAMKERAGFTASSREELLGLLDAVARGAVDARVTRGGVRDGTAETLRALLEDDEVDLESALERWFARGKHGKLLQLWVNGLSVDWAKLSGPGRGRRVSLPTYPFARDRYWLQEKPKPALPEPSANGHGHGPNGHPSVQTVQEEWLTVTEGWKPEPWSGDLDWLSLVRKHEGARVAILGPEDAEGSSIAGLARQLGEAAGLAPAWQIEFRRVDQLEGWIFATPPDVILILAPEAESAQSDRLQVARVFELARSLMRQAWDSTIRIYHLHESAPERPRLHLRALAGLLRSAMLENENHSWSCVELRGSQEPGARGQILLREWLAGGDERGFGEIQYQGAERYRHHLVETRPATETAPVFRQNGTYIVAGGLGPLGELLCRSLAARYHARIVILGRGALDDRKRDQCRQIEAAGGGALYYQVDITDRESLARAWPALKKEAGPIHGLIHLARSVEDSLLVAKSLDSFERVVRAKVDGTLLLDEWTASEPLDFFLMFSSMAAFGVRGSADYGYSAAFQNAFARHRAAETAAGRRFGQTMAQAWGGWTADKYHSDSRNQRMRQEGFSLIDMEQAFPWIESQAWTAGPFLGLMRVHDKEMVLRGLGVPAPDCNGRPGHGAPPPPRIESFLDLWEDRQRNGTAVTPAEVSRVLRSEEVGSLSESLADRLHALLVPIETTRPAAAPRVGSGDKSGRDLAASISGALAEILGLNEVDEDKSFQDYGMDSVSGVRFAMLLEKKLKIQMPPQKLVEHSTTRALAAFLAANESQGGVMVNGGDV